MMKENQENLGMWHEHPSKPNPTGGTPERSKNPEPVTGWKY